MTDPVDRLLDTVRFLKDELSIIAQESALAMAPDNADRLRSYVNGVLERLDEELYRWNLSSLGEGCESL